jgi:hypothetical protein
MTTLTCFHRPSSRGAYRSHSDAIYQLGTHGESGTKAVIGLSLASQWLPLLRSIFWSGLDITAMVKAGRAECASRFKTVPPSRVPRLKRRLYRMILLVKMRLSRGKLTSFCRGPGRLPRPQVPRQEGAAHEAVPLQQEERVLGSVFPGFQGSSTGPGCCRRRCTKRGGPQTGSGGQEPDQLRGPRC